MQVRKVFYFPGGLLFVTQPSPNLERSPAQHGAVTESGRDVWINLNLSWNELYAGDIITKVGKSFNSNILKEALFYKLQTQI